MGCGVDGVVGAEGEGVYFDEGMGVPSSWWTRILVLIRVLLLELEFLFLVWDPNPTINYL